MLRRLNYEMDKFSPINQKPMNAHEYEDTYRHFQILKKLIPLGGYASYNQRFKEVLAHTKDLAFEDIAAAFLQGVPQRQHSAFMMLPIHTLEYLFRASDLKTICSWQLRLEQRKQYVSQAASCLDIERPSSISTCPQRAASLA